MPTYRKPRFCAVRDGSHDTWVDVGSAHPMSVAAKVTLAWNLPPARPGFVRQFRQPRASVQIVSEMLRIGGCRSCAFNTDCGDGYLFLDPASSRAVNSCSKSSSPCGCPERYGDDDDLVDVDICTPMSIAEIATFAWTWPTGWPLIVQQSRQPLLRSRARGKRGRTLLSALPI